ncbi:Transposase [Bacteroidales bacterium Barb6XT]|nr:Transposase [Bacteroidales bacterium Barb6XT]
MNCPKCSSEKRVNQVYLKAVSVINVKNADVIIRLNSSLPPNRLLMKKQALRLYLEGLGFRSVGRFLNVSHVRVYEWIRSFGLQEKMLQSEAKETETVEMDEHSCINQKKLLLDMDCC